MKKLENLGFVEKLVLISFTAGCFGFGWPPFLTMIALALIYVLTHK